jgi:glutamyl-tRNA reductase
VRSETAIGESPASVSSAAAALAQQVFGELDGRRVLVVGAGRIGELAAANLASRGATIAFVANRTIEAARELARRFDAEPVSLDELSRVLATVDVVVTSTSAPETVLHARDVPPQRRRPLFFVDIAVPRDVDPAVHELDGCYLYDIDDLEAVVAETLAGRRAEAARAEQLVADEAQRFREWQASLDVVPAIASLRARAEAIRDAELAKLGRLSDTERRTVESVTSQILNKLLHLPTVRMKQAAAAAEGAAYADAVRHLFGLEDER